MLKFLYRITIDISEPNINQPPTNESVIKAMQLLHGARVSVLVVFQSSGTVYMLQNCRMNA